MESTECLSTDVGMKKELHRNGSVLSRKESARRKHAKIERLDISSLYKSTSAAQSIISISKKHILESLDCDLLAVPAIVTAELADLGIRFESHPRQSRSKSRKPTHNSAIITDRFLESVEFKLENSTPVRLYIPHVIRQTCEFIRKEISAEGVFRKSGLTSRVQKLKQRFAEESTDVFHNDDTVFDASSVLKQYLRELPCPLIPYDVQPIFLKCLEHPDEQTKVEAVLLSVYLLPLSNIHILTYLMAFLYEVVNHSHQNRMGYKNLALVMTPNIMPVEERKNINKGKEVMLNEKLAHEKNRKVVEILILYGDYVGWVSPKLANALEVQLPCRNSDDELEADRGRSRDGRRKKRRSGSLTRMFGFLRKVTNGKGSDTPCSGIDTPNDVGLHTPVMKGSTKKRAIDEPLFSTQKKKTILDAVRRNGLNGGDSNSPSGFLACPSPAVCYHPSPMRSDWKQLNNLITATPNIVRDKKRSKSTPDNARILVLQSAKSSTKHNKLGFGRKSGKKVEESFSENENELPALDCETPEKTNPLLILPKYFKNFSLLPSKSILKTSISAGYQFGHNDNGKKCSEKMSSYLSAPEIPSSHKDKDALLHQQVNQTLQKSERDGSVVSIHHLTTSPRKKSSSALVLSNASDSINPDLSLNISEVKGASIENECKGTDTLINQSEGEYVTIAPTATNDDIRNEAFIESSSSLDTTDKDREITSDENEIQERRIRKEDLRTDDGRFMPVESLRMTPLIKDIQQLTLYAQMDPDISFGIDQKKEKEVPQQDEIDSPPPLPDKSKILELERSRNRTPRIGCNKIDSPAIAAVEKEFERTLKEEKIINLQIEMKRGGPRPCNTGERDVKRRGSVQERGLSPSQRKINSFRRRRSHDPVKTHTPVIQSPRFMSLRSPRSRPIPPPLVRSPTRCTLRRGRPNTAWTGLPKPSPVRGTGNISREGVRSSRRNTPVSSSTTTPRDKSVLKDKLNVNGQVMRRMSSVQELVNKLESKGKISNSKSAVDVVPERQKIRRPTALNIPNNNIRLSLPSNSGLWHVQESKTAKLASQMNLAGDGDPPPPPTQAQNQNITGASPNMGNEWLNGSTFDFECTPIISPCKVPVGSRESIHFLKTKNAGKVSANVKMFDGMVKNVKSPSIGKSMIPRYTALHSLPSKRNSSAQ